ncbi:hypothetical protein LX32DRAFT_716391 [Colletotrichum zoysiae]|uniref:Fungal-type protein kinase domain-containing protein n=1 Tax=Colletotrichum zoysiae TaxID=1216348 RepID=A0AAD9H1A7_9PEZI|nr:hypothetical protein LX32DRAFT_716391 [Colletotrichum zoysiae]
MEHDNSWQYPERDEEGDLVSEATDKGVVNVVRYYHHETVQVHKMGDDIYDNVPRGLDVTTAINYRPGRRMRPGHTVTDAPWKGRSRFSRKRPSSQTESALHPSKCISNKGRKRTIESVFVGTRAFRAIGALQGEQYSFMHDLELFFWVVTEGGVYKWREVERAGAA